MTVVNTRCSTQDSTLVEKIRTLARRHRCLLSRLSSAELLADAIAMDLARLEKQLEAGEHLGLGADDVRADMSAKGHRKQELRLLAGSGVTTLEIKVRADGLSDVRIDGGKQFSLPPMLADLLHVLAMSGRETNDRLVGWKTIDEVTLVLAKQGGRPVTRHAVTQGIYRLRRELFHRGGANPYLIQTNRQRGVRFALKQQ